jgi:hypothetical protein
MKQLVRGSSPCSKQSLLAYQLADDSKAGQGPAQGNSRNVRLELFFPESHATCTRDIAKFSTCQNK